MLNDTLQALYTAVKYNDMETYKRLLNGLHKVGMDNYTIKVLIEELVKENIIK